MKRLVFGSKLVLQASCSNRAPPCTHLPVGAVESSDGLCEDFSMSSRLYRGGNPIKVASKAPRPEMWVCLIASLMVLLPCAGCVGLAAPNTGISALQITTVFLPTAPTARQSN